MGKGKGKPSNWAAKLPLNCIFIELKNVRYGRSDHFLNQIKYKLPGDYILVFRFNKYYIIPFFRKVHTKYTYYL
jgi:ribosomal protein L16/L10AE